MATDEIERERLPDRLRRRFSGAWTRVWRNDRGVDTYRVERAGEPAVFVKLAAGRVGVSLREEAARLRWAADHLPVPEVLGRGEAQGWQWLVTAALPGVNAADKAHTGRPNVTVPLLADGLRRIHDVPVGDCPFGFGLDQALALAERRVASGLVEAGRDFDPCHAHLTPESAVEKLVRDRPNSEDLVVCHGDYCFPNILIDHGEVAGFVDLGSLGVADRWWDLAVASWSAVWNVGEDWEQEFVAAYGREWDQSRADYYRLLYDVVG